MLKIITTAKYDEMQENLKIYKELLSCFREMMCEKDAEYRIAPKTKTGWINIYPPSHDTINTIPDTIPNAITGMYSNKQIADEYCDKENRIACIQVTYTEGEGL